MFKLPNIVVNIDHLTVHMLMPSQEAPAGNGDLGDIKKGIDKMSAEMDRMAAVVTKTSDRSSAIMALATSIIEQLRANAADPVALNALADQLEANASAMGGWVEANTSPAPAGPVVAPADVAPTVDP